MLERLIGRALAKRVPVGLGPELPIRFDGVLKRQQRGGFQLVLDPE